MLLHPTRNPTCPELLIWYLSRPIFSPVDGVSLNSIDMRPGGDPSGRVAGVGESSVLLDKLLDGSGDTVWTDGVKGGEDVVEVDGDDDVVGADNAAVGGCEAINELDEFWLDSEDLRAVMTDTTVTIMSPRFTRIDTQPIIILCVLLCFLEGKIDLINFFHPLVILLL